MLSDIASQKYAAPSILGQGALGKTYLTKRITDGQQVVVKEIDLGVFFADEASAVEAELRVLLNGTSDYLLNIYSIFRDNALNYLYLETEYCAGGSLEDLIKQHRKSNNPVSEPFVWEVLAQLAYGLRDLHRLYEQPGRTVLVRLKPSCVLFTSSGRLVLGDLSPCSLSNSLPIRINSSLPPEVFEDKRAPRGPGHSHGFTASSDMWSLGCILLELCTLQSVMTLADQIDDVVNAKMNHYSEDIRILTRMCLRKQASDRISSANLCLLPQIKQALSGLRSSTASYTSPPSPGILRSESRGQRYNMVEGDTELILAAATGKASAVQQYIMQAGMSNAQGQTAMILAAMYGHSDCVALLLECEHGLRDAAGKTALMYAAENGHAGCVGLLKEAEGGLSSAIGQTALMLAATAGSEVCVHLLLTLESGMKDAAGTTALMHAVLHEKLSCVNILMLCEARITNLEGETALMSAVRFENIECIKKLVELEAGIPNAEGKLAITVAIEQHYLEGFNILLEHEAVTEEACRLVLKHLMQEEGEEFYQSLEAHAAKHGIALGSGLRNPVSVCKNKTELMLAAEIGSVERVTQYLEQRGQITTDGWTALMIAAKNNHLQCCELLLQEANIGAKGRNTALTHAMAANAGSCVDILYPLERYSSNVTSLMWHSYKGDIEAVVQNLRDARKQTITGVTALMYAAQQGHIACVQILVDYELKLRSLAGWTALMYAAAFGNAACIWLLFAESRLENKDGETALILATKGGHSSCLDRLCQYEYRLRNRQGWTALMHAAAQNDISAVKLLVQHEAGIQDRRGQTALMTAIINNHLECAEMLLMEAQLATHKPLPFTGTLSGSSDTKGTTALLIAMRIGFAEGTRLLGRLEDKSTPVTNLMIGASAGSIDQVRYYINQAGMTDEIGATALMYAAIAGNAACVELLMDIEAGRKTDAGDTALMLALKQNHLACMMLLLDSEGHLYESSKQSLVRTAIFLEKRICFDTIIDYYFEKRRLNVQEVLEVIIATKKTEYMASLGACARKYGRPVCSAPLSYRERVNQPTELMLAARAGDTTAITKHISQLGYLCEGKLLTGGGTALQWAVCAGHVEAARLLLAEVGILSDDGHSSLLRACEKGDQDLIALLMPYELDLAGVTQLIANASMGDYNACEHILETPEGISLLGRATDTGFTALMLASRHGHEDIVTLLCPREADFRSPKSVTALMEAAVNNRDECARSLVESEGGVQNNDGFTALMLAASLGHLAIVEVLTPTEHGMQTHTGTTALMLAASNGHVECVQQLTAHEACIQNKTGWTALMYAASKGHANCLFPLFSEAFIRNNDGQLALDIALQQNKYKCFEILQGREARIRGMTDLMLLTIRNDVDTVALLAEVQSNCKDAEKCTALMYACKFGHLKCAEILANYEAGHLDKRGYSALMYAIEEGNVACVMAVIALEIGVWRKNGPSPLDVAITKGDNELIQLINAYLECSVSQHRF